MASATTVQNTLQVATEDDNAETCWRFTNDELNCEVFFRLHRQTRYRNAVTYSVSSNEESVDYQVVAFVLRLSTGLEPERDQEDRPIDDGGDSESESYRTSGNAWLSIVRQPPPLAFVDVATRAPPFARITASIAVKIAAALAFTGIPEHNEIERLLLVDEAHLINGGETIDAERLLPLSLIMAMTKGATFYGRLGFVGAREKRTTRTFGNDDDDFRLDGTTGLWRPAFSSDEPWRTISSLPKFTLNGDPSICVRDYYFSERNKLRKGTLSEFEFEHLIDSLKRMLSVRLPHRMVLERRRYRQWLARDIQLKRTECSVCGVVASQLCIRCKQTVLCGERCLERHHCGTKY